MTLSEKGKLRDSAERAWDRELQRGDSLALHPLPHPLRRARRPRRSRHRRDAASLRDRIGASFNPPLANAVGRVEGAEARTQGHRRGAGPGTKSGPSSSRAGASSSPTEKTRDLTSTLGVADIEGIQSQGVMALAKHFDAYTQETARARLNSQVTLRALAELYNAPFEAAVRAGPRRRVDVRHGTSQWCARVLRAPTPTPLSPSWGFHRLRALRRTSGAKLDRGLC